MIYDSIVGPHTFTLSREMTAEQARAFNPWNMLRATPDGKVDDWDPAGVREKYVNDGSDVFRMSLAAAVTWSRGAIRRLSRRSVRQHRAAGERIDSHGRAGGYADGNRAAAACG